MCGINFGVKDLIFAERLIPDGEEISEREISRFRRFNVDHTACIVGMDRVHARQTDSEICGNGLLHAIYENLQIRMDVKPCKRIGGAAERQFTVGFCGNGLATPQQESYTNHDDDACNPPYRIR